MDEHEQNPGTQIPYSLQGRNVGPSRINSPLSTFHFKLQPAVILKRAIEILCDIEYNPTGTATLDVNEDEGIVFTVNNPEFGSWSLTLTDKTLDTFHCNEPLVGKRVDLTHIYDMLVRSDDDDIVYLVHHHGSNDLCFTFVRVQDDDQELTNYFKAYVPDHENGSDVSSEDDNDDSNSFHINGYSAEQSWIIAQSLFLYMFNQILNAPNDDAVSEPDDVVSGQDDAVSEEDDAVSEDEGAISDHATAAQRLCRIFTGDTVNELQYRSEVILDNIRSWEDFACTVRFHASCEDQASYSETGVTPDACWPGRTATYYGNIDGEERTLEWRVTDWAEAQRLLTKVVYIKFST